MATVQEQIEIARPKASVWGAIRDVGAIHKGLVPRFVVDCKLEGDSRMVTFGNGMVVREVIVSVDDGRAGMRGRPRAPRSRTTTRRSRFSRRVTRRLASCGSRM